MPLCEVVIKLDGQKQNISHVCEETKIQKCSVYFQRPSLLTTLWGLVTQYVHLNASSMQPHLADTQHTIGYLFLASVAQPTSCMWTIASLSQGNRKGRDWTKWWILVPPGWPSTKVIKHLQKVVLVQIEMREQNGSSPSIMTFGSRSISCSSL